MYKAEEFRELARLLMSGKNDTFKNSLVVAMKIAVERIK